MAGQRVYSSACTRAEVTDIIVSQDWEPRVGGAHYWLLEVYRRWGSPVSVFTATPAVDGDGGSDVVEGASETCDSLVVMRNADFVDSVGLSPSTWLPVFRNVIRLLRQIDGKQSTLHCKAQFPEGLIALLARSIGARTSKVVVYAHGEEILVARSSRLLSRIARFVYRHADLVIANSQNTKKLVLGFAKVERIKVIHPGVDSRAFVHSGSERSAYRKKLGWSDDELVVVTVARLEPRKNIQRVIEALNTLREEGIPIRYLCVGDGVERSALRQFVEANRLQQWVTFVDRVTEEQKRLLFCSADLHVMASVQHGEMFEGFGIVFLEAAAAGLASVSGNTGGQREAVHHGLTGLNVDGEDTDALVQGCRRLLTDRIQRHAMAEAGRLWAAANDWQLVSGATRSALETLRNDFNRGASP
jgi:phosphatidylinositol alpha-1,6-mannosyltransferase